MTSNIKDYLKYDGESGDFTWIKSRSGVSVGGLAGTKISNGCGKTYVVIGFSGKRYVAHHLAWLFTYGAMPPNQVDHIDGNGINNSISNLRLVTDLENKKNIRLSSKNTSGFVGVHYHSGTKKWRATICVNRKIIHLGLYKEKRDAIKARENANKEYGFHENHGQTRPL